MTIKSLSELQEADERTLPFSPMGLGGRMRPEDSAEFQQQVVARYKLDPAVAEGTRQSFDQTGICCTLTPGMRPRKIRRNGSGVRAAAGTRWRGSLASGRRTTR
jgi:hypothetical protein